MACSRPNAKLRGGEIIPSTAEHATEPTIDHAHAQGAPARMSWARLLKRVFDIDIEHCPSCGGSLQIIAAPSDGHRGSAGNCQNPRPSGPTHPRPTSLPARRLDLLSERANGEQIKRFRPLHRPNRPKQNRNFY